MHNPVQDSLISKLLTVVSWISTILLSFAVGSALIASSLIIPFLNEMTSIVMGWSIVLFTLLALALKLIDRN